MNRHRIITQTICSMNELFLKSLLFVLFVISALWIETQLVDDNSKQNTCPQQSEIKLDKTLKENSNYGCYF